MQVDLTGKKLTFVEDRLTAIGTLAARTSIISNVPCHFSNISQALVIKAWRLSLKNTYLERIENRHVRNIYGNDLRKWPENVLFLHFSTEILSVLGEQYWRTRLTRNRCLENLTKGRQKRLKEKDITPRSKALANVFRIEEINA